MFDTLTAPVQLSTARLRIRKPKLGDATPLFHAYATDLEVVRYLSWQVHQCEQDTLNFLQLCLDSWSCGVAYSYVIETFDKLDDPMGMIDIRPQGQRVEFGYVLARECWGRGYMSEALSCLVDWSLDQSDVWRASAYCDVENLASARVMQKAGMMFEGVLCRYAVFPNVSSAPRDCRMYAKVRA